MEIEEIRKKLKKAQVILDKNGYIFSEYAHMPILEQRPLVEDKILVSYVDVYGIDRDITESMLREAVNLDVVPFKEYPKYSIQFGVIVRLDGLIEVGLDWMDSRVSRVLIEYWQKMNRLVDALNQLDILCTSDEFNYVMADIEKNKRR